MSHDSTETRLPSGRELACSLARLYRRSYCVEQDGFRFMQVTAMDELPHKQLVQSDPKVRILAADVSMQIRLFSRIASSLRTLMRLMGAGSRI